MDVRNMTQSQLLQRSPLQLGEQAPVQERKIQESEKASTRFEGPDRDEKDTIKQLTEGMNEFLRPMNTSLKFEFHDKLERYYVTIIDDETDEVVKEIPAEKMLDIYASMAESLGFIVDEKI